ncbi:MAG: hypothetical protein Tsb0032_39580 [Kiloniellaceae bacterium]
MSQHKAASLTSNLFACKGRASPASMLIAELEGVAPEEIAAKSPGPQPKPGSNGHLKLNLNGSSAAKTAKAAEPELPLLAFVEAQAAVETAADVSADPAEDTTVDDGGERAAEVAVHATSPAFSGETPEEPSEPRPPASLLDSGARALRKANGAQSVPLPDAPSVAASAAEDAAGPQMGEAADGEGVKAAPTVSGDANVAAIEDAPLEADPPEDSEVVAAPEAVEAPEVVEASGIAEAPNPLGAGVRETASEEAGPENAAAQEMHPEERNAVAENEVAGTAPEAPGLVETPGPAAADVRQAKSADRGDPADVKDSAAVATQKIDAGKAVSATVALRQAKALQPAVTPRAAPGPVFSAHHPAEKAAGPAVPPKAPAALPWRSAAVVALGIAIGLGAYMVFSGQPEQTDMETAAPVAESAIPGGETAAAGAAAPVAATSATAPQAATPAAETQSEAAGEAPAVAAPADTASLVEDWPEPSFDVIRIEPDGQSIIAGRAAPGSEWILLNNGSPIASVKADINGEWVILPDASLVPGANAFSLVPKTERGRVAIPAPGAESEAVPANADPAGEGTETRSDAVGPTDGRPASAEATAERALAGIALPKPKPVTTTGTAPLPAIGVAADGAYELQVASVRQSADAERERTRLAAAFPDLLGPLDLRVQEATVEGAGTFFRVRSGAIDDLGIAREICRRLEAEGQGCLVVRRVPASGAVPQTEVVQERNAASAAPNQQAQRPE